MTDIEMTESGLKQLQASLISLNAFAKELQDIFDDNMEHIRVEISAYGILYVLGYGEAAEPAVLKVVM